MLQWYRIFGTSNDSPEPEARPNHLRGLGAEATGPFHGDEQGWFRAELVLIAAPLTPTPLPPGERGRGEGAAPVELERYLATEEGIRSELNAWAAWIETLSDSPTHQRLMQQLISTTQLITLRRPDDPTHEALLDYLCTGASQFLARTTAGVYQVDGQGFYTSDGTLLVHED